MPTISMTVNGKSVSADVGPRTLLVQYLRDEFVEVKLPIAVLVAYIHEVVQLLGAELDPDGVHAATQLCSRDAAVTIQVELREA